MNFQGKTVVVTGAASGIGLATAEAFARAGASVVIADLSAEKGGKEAARLAAAGGKASFVQLDVASDELDRKLCQDSARPRRGARPCQLRRLRQGPALPRERQGVLGARRRHQHAGPDQADPRAHRSDVRAQVRPDRERRERRRPGRKLWAKPSIPAPRPGSSASPRRWRARAPATIVTVNCVCPGPTDTPLMAAVPEKIREAFIKAIPMRRFGRPAKWRRRSRSSPGRHTDYITGQVLSVSGGLTMAG